MKKWIPAAAVVLLAAATALAGEPKATVTVKTEAAAKKNAPEATVDRTKLLDPSKLNEQAPDVFSARFETSKGPFVIEVHRSWAPNGADRFYNLVNNGFYDDTRFFRVVSGFMAQFGIHGDPKVSEVWKPAMIEDDPVKATNTRGMVSFAMRGPATRTTQLFINYVDNIRLDPMGFAPIGQVVEGMDVVDALYSGYGEGAPRGRGPDQGRMQSEGNSYLAAEFPELDYVKSARIVKK